MQFSHNKKAKETEDETLAAGHSIAEEDKEDKEDVDLDGLLVDGSNEEVDVVGEGDADDEIDPAVQASDNATLEAALYMPWGGARAQTPRCGCALASSELGAVLCALQHHNIMSTL